MAGNPDKRGFVLSISVNYGYKPPHLADLTRKCSPGIISVPWSYLLLTMVWIISFTPLRGQDCPPNIDFESGDFTNWKCYTGHVAAIANENEISLIESGGPVSNRHTMYSSATNPGNDQYGGFPIMCPNGSGYSIRLGNDLGGTEAEGISYEFTIPANRNTYSLVYHYAVVFQDPFHLEYQQPRLELEIMNVTDNELIDCSSFTFFPNGSLLPGFFISPIRVDSVDVWCKDWSAVSINLNNQAGKTIRLFFKTADCTFRRHFGYAYIDVNSECSSEFVGAAYCPGDTLTRVTGPYGYQDYTWFNSNFSQQLGAGQTITLRPPPPVGTILALEVLPYNGYGCPDTFYARMVDTLNVQARAGPDLISCNGIPEQIGAIPVPGIVYQWTPVTGLSNPLISNPRAGPLGTTAYTLRASSQGGGCIDYDTVIVTASITDTALHVLGKEQYCEGSLDSAVLVVNPNTSILWYNGESPIPGGVTNRYRAMETGNFRARIINSDGCEAFTRTIPVVVEIPVPGIRYPDQFAVEELPQVLTARDLGGNSYLWQPPVFLQDATLRNPTFRGEGDITYTIDILSQAGCLTVDTQYVKTFKEVKFYVPTAFTPNNDGLNDYLRPTAAGIKEIRFFRIYNRWGQLVFDLASDPRGWDGRISGKDQSSQVVVWVAEGIGVDNQRYSGKGTALLIR